MPAGLSVLRRPVPPPHALGPVVLTSLVSTLWISKFPDFSFSERSPSHADNSPPNIHSHRGHQHTMQDEGIFPLLPAVRGAWKRAPCSQLASALTLFTKRRHRCPADALPPRPGLPRLAEGQRQGGGLPSDTRAQTEDLNLVGTLPTCTRRDQLLHGGATPQPPQCPQSDKDAAQTSYVRYTPWA